MAIPFAPLPPAESMRLPFPSATRIQETGNSKCLVQTGRLLKDNGQRMVSWQYVQGFSRGQMRATFVFRLDCLKCVRYASRMHGGINVAQEHLAGTIQVYE